MGGTYVTPVAEGLLDEDFVNTLKMADTYNEDSFDREYGSHWTGDVEYAFFSAEKFDKCRVLNQPEEQYSGRTSKEGFYVFGIDVGRIDCTTEICIFKVTPQPVGAAIKSLVNLYSIDSEHFEEQAIKIKRFYFKFMPRRIALDANGLGIGLVDELIKSQIDPDTGDYLPPFGVYNDEEGIYKKYRTADTIPDVLFLIKANAPINTEAYSYAQAQILASKVKFLIDEGTAKAKLMETKVGQNMNSDKRNQELMPFVLTTGLKMQMMNLTETNEGINIILKQSSRGIKKDRFSAFVYGMYYIKQEEDRLKKRKKRDITKFFLFS